MKSIGILMTILICFSAHAQYSNLYEMKSARKVGVGPVFGGAYGKWGVKLDLNIEEDDGVITGVGGSDSYNSFNIGWKRNFNETFANFYSNLGFAALFGNQVPGRTEYLIEQLHKPEDGNNISQQLTVLGLGFQYSDLGSELAGLSFYLEGNILHAWKSSKLIPTGSAGVTYFF